MTYASAMRIVSECSDGDGRRGSDSSVAQVIVGRHEMRLCSFLLLGSQGAGFGAGSCSAALAVEEAEVAVPACCSALALAKSAPPFHPALSPHTTNTPIKLQEGFTHREK